MEIKNLAAAVVCGTFIAGASIAEDWDMPLSPPPTTVIYPLYLKLLTFLAILFGCLTCCLPAFLPFRFALEVAAYSAELSDFIAADGKYLSPVAFGPCVEGFPAVEKL